MVFERRLMEDLSTHLSTMPRLAARVIIAGTETATQLYKDVRNSHLRDAGFPSQFLGGSMKANCGLLG